MSSACQNQVLRYEKREEALTDTYPVLVAVISKEYVITDIVVVQVLECSVAVRGIALIE